MLLAGPSQKCVRNVSVLNPTGKAWECTCFCLCRITDMEWKYRKHEIDTETRDRNIIYIMDDLQQLRSRENKLVEYNMNQMLSINLNGK